MKFDIRRFFESRLRKRKFHQNRTRIKGTLHDARYTFLITSRSIPPRMRNVSDKSCRENQNTHFVFSKTFIFFSGNCAFHEKKNWKNIVDRGQATDDNMMHARCMMDP